MYKVATVIFILVVAAIFANVPNPFSDQTDPAVSHDAPLYRPSKEQSVASSDAGARQIGGDPGKPNLGCLTCGPDLDVVGPKASVVADQPSEAAAAVQAKLEAEQAKSASLNHLLSLSQHSAAEQIASARRELEKEHARSTDLVRDLAQVREQVARAFHDRVNGMDQPPGDAAAPSLEETRLTDERLARAADPSPNRDGSVPTAVRLSAGKALDAEPDASTGPDANPIPEAGPQRPDPARPTAEPPPLQSATSEPANVEAPPTVEPPPVRSAASEPANVQASPIATPSSPVQSAAPEPANVQAPPRVEPPPSVRAAESEPAKVQAPSTVEPPPVRSAASEPDKTQATPTAEPPPVQSAASEPATVQASPIATPPSPVQSAASEPAKVPATPTLEPPTIQSAASEPAKVQATPTVEPPPVRTADLTTAGLAAANASSSDEIASGGAGVTPAATLPKGMPPRVTLAYARGSEPSRRHAVALGQTLRAQGIEVAEPIGLPITSPVDRVTYFYTGDRASAEHVAELTVSSSAVRGRIPADGQLPRPGTIAIALALAK